MRIRVVGDKVQTWLNGQPMVDFSDEKIGQANGSIALQIHEGGGIRVKWRNLLIEEIIIYITQSCRKLSVPTYVN